MDKIFRAVLDRSVLEAYRTLFPVDDDYIEEPQFSKIHKIVLGITSHNLTEELTLDRMHASINARDSTGKTPLMWAACRGDSISVDLLLKAGADLNICDKFHESALLYAVQSSNLESVKNLLNFGSNAGQASVIQWNALHLSAVYSNNGHLIRCLLDAGIDVNGRTNWGTTPLQCASSRNNTISAQMLLDCGAEINALDNVGDSALHQSILDGSDDTTKLLLGRGASYNLPDSNGDYLLHAAGKHGGLRALEIMQSTNLKDTDPDALNREGKTAIQVARERHGAEDAFAENMQILVADICIRNASQQRPSQATNNSIPGRTHKIFVGSTTPSAYVRMTKDSSQFLSTYQHVLQLIQRLWTSSVKSLSWKSVLIGWILGCFWAVIMYLFIGPRDLRRGVER